jgi:hypothetical protein
MLITKETKAKDGKFIIMNIDIFYKPLNINEMKKEIMSPEEEGN